MTLPSVDEVRSIAHLEAIPEDEARRLSRDIHVRHYQAREMIVVEGEPAPGFYYLRSGRARIFRTGPDGREQILRLLSPGETFGEVPMFDASPSPASVEAIQPCEVLLVPTNVFLDLLERYPSVAIALLRHFAGRLRSFTDLIGQISLQTVQARLARYLYIAAREEGVQTPEGIVVAREITQQDLAALVGSVREVVTRTLRVLEDDGIVQVRRKEFVVRDLDALRRLL